MWSMPYLLPGKSCATQGTSKDHSGHGSPQCRPVALSGTWLLAAQGSGCSGQHSTPAGRRRSTIQQLDQEYCVIGISLRAYVATVPELGVPSTLQLQQWHARTDTLQPCIRDTAVPTVGIFYSRDSAPEHKICWASQDKFLHPCAELPREPSITCQYELRLISRHMQIDLN